MSMLIVMLSACASAPPDARDHTASDPVAPFLELLEREPAHVGAMYIGARTAARSGDADQAMDLLHRLRAANFGDALEPADFAALAERAAYRALSAGFSDAAPAQGQAASWTETRCADLLPEGTAWDARRRELLLSSGRLRTMVAVDADGRCREVVPRAEGGLMAVLGMAVDASRDALWVASTAAPFMIEANSVKPGTTLLARIDLDSGHVAEVYPLRGSGMLNDLTIDATGHVYATDSANGTIVRLRRGDTEPMPMLPAHTFEGPNGITRLGDALLVADFHALWLIDTLDDARPRVRRVAAATAAYWGGFDGLASDGQRVVGIQNLVGRGRVWRLDIDVANARLRNAELLLRGHAALRNPTTGALVGDQFLFTADPDLQRWTDGALSTLPEDRRGHTILSLPIQLR